MRGASRAFAEFVSGILAGIALGYVAALLLAPQEGADSRARLHQSADALRERPQHFAEEVQTRVQHAMEQGRQAAAEARAELEQVAGVAEADTPESASHRPAASI